MDLNKMNFNTAFFHCPRKKLKALNYIYAIFSLQLKKRWVFYVNVLNHYNL